MIIVLGMIQVAKKIPFDDPNVLNSCRAAYIASNLIIAGLYVYVQLQINKKKGTFPPICGQKLSWIFEDYFASVY
jgi:hypothetical protein